MSNCEMDKNGEVNQQIVEADTHIDSFVSEEIPSGETAIDQVVDNNDGDAGQNCAADENVSSDPQEINDTRAIDNLTESEADDTVEKDGTASTDVSLDRQTASPLNEEAGLGQVVAKHYNQLEEKGLNARTKSRIFYMRNFNNWIKSMTINEIVDKFRKLEKEEIAILDMCCGKGGDILKWLKTKMTRHVVFVDIAETSVQQCQERYNHIESEANRNDRNRGRGNHSTFSAEFYTADCTKERLRHMYKDPNIRFDLVSVQFSFHYCFESLPQAKIMLRNVSENLKAGGFFIGTTTNADRIVKRIREVGSQEFGNEIYRIKVENSEPFPIFGAKYYFQLDDVVNDCPEFLVNFNAFVKLAGKFGLKLVFKHTFDEYFKMRMESGHFLLDRMQAMETYPHFDGESLSSDQEEDYIHAKKFKDETPHCRRFGTLSKSEWEAVSLYLVFGFEKVEY